ncbi:MAG TPA: TetR/AcrR family transcriptional regulator [Pseudonocardia sp.]|jgi:AcrR family transcriptional regulator|nr:TetR/AcrR family transcriptional regulator [Pseudonocardia sp.]
MPAKELTRADAQRARVTALSAGIFSRRGFRATSMNEIAAAAGLSKPTLYHYFRSKEELLVRIYSDVLDESLVLARQTVAQAATPLEAIRDLIASRVTYTCEHQALLKVCFEEEHELPEALAQEVLTRRRAFESFFVAELRRHLEENPSVRLGMEPKIYVNMCLGAVNWCYKWYHPDGPLSAAQLGQQMAGTLTASLS